MTATFAGKLTRSAEDYLKAIYSLSREGQASTSDIAQRLDLSPASVSGMLKRLAEQGLIERTPYKGVFLTVGGMEAALRVVRRHRVIESYLVEMLGFSWDNVHDEAERLEHAVSDALIGRMAEALGNPEFDPHGDPIPAPDGSMVSVATIPLPQVARGAVVELCRVTTDDPEQLRYLSSLGLNVGVAMEVVDQAPFQGPTTITVSGTRHVLGNQLAGRIQCRQPAGRLP